MKPVILVTGKNGQVGSELKVLSTSYPQYEFLFTGMEELDISDSARVAEIFATVRPAVCINCAAYTAVDKAETERETAMRINGDAVGFLATACRNAGALFIHISTDYVFNGKGTRPYNEDDPTSPVNFYGSTKLRGEKLARSNFPASIIIRTSWVYSSFGNNFVKTMLRLMAERESISVVSDQFGSPTYAADLAQAILDIIPKAAGNGGIYHFSNKGAISWFQFATAIKELSNSGCRVLPIDTAGYPTPASRPAYSVMNTGKISDVFGIEILSWKASLDRLLNLLVQ